MTTLFSTTLETALTGTNGFSSVGAAPTLDTAAVIKGVQCARWAAVSSGIGTLQPASDQNEVYFSFYIKFNAHAAAPRFLRCVDSAGLTTINLVINSTGAPSVKLRNGSTTIGTSATQLTAGTIYRLGLRVKKNTGAGVADGIATLYIAVGDTAFGAASVTSTAQVLDNPIDKIEVGATNSTAIDCYMDDLYWSDSAMPAASGGGAYPAGPTGLTAAVASSTSVNLTWTDNATNETAYTVERATNPAGPWTVLTSALAANTVAYTATGLTTATLYYFRVKATNATGSSAYSATASATPAAIGVWNWTYVGWPYRERYQPIVIASTGGTGYIALTTDDPTNPSAAWTYYSGPMAADGVTLTLAASKAVAETNAVALPLDGRWLLPSVIETRYVQLYHRHTAAYTLREFYPYRVVEADQVSAEFIRGMYISGHQLVVDQLSALSANLGTATAGTFQTGVSGARTVMTSADYGGLISYDADDNYDPTLGTGTYQILLSKADGKLYAGGGNICLDANGITSTVLPYFSLLSAYTFHSGSTEMGGMYAVDAGSGFLNQLSMLLYPLTGRNAEIQIVSTAPDTKTSTIALVAVDNAITANDGAKIELTFSNSVNTVDIGSSLGTTTTTMRGLTVASAIDTATNATSDVVRIAHNTSGAPTTNFGSAVRWLLESSTTVDQNAAQINVLWTTATHASRQAAMVFYAYDAGGAREFLRGGANGTAPTIGFLGAGAVARQTVTGSRGGNAALASVLTALANLGLITDSSS